MWIRLVVLALLVLQTTVLVLSIKATSRWNDRYIKSTVVCSTEVAKLFICYINMVANGRASPNVLSVLRRHVLAQPLEVARVAIPALLYVLQNNLLHYSIDKMDAPTFQVLYQMKTLTTAFLGYLFLGKTFGLRKVTALLILVAGVVVVEVDSRVSPHSVNVGTTEQSLGLAALVTAAISSGVCGVYLEKLIKGSSDIWSRNLQIAFVSVWLSLGMALLNDWALISTNGFFSNYSPSVLWVIVMQAFGGLLVSFVMKYADNIAKAFATAFSTVLIALISSLHFGTLLSGWFVMGSGLVVASIILYST